MFNFIAAPHAGPMAEGTHAAQLTPPAGFAAGNVQRDSSCSAPSPFAKKNYSSEAKWYWRRNDMARDLSKTS